MTDQKLCLLGTNLPSPVRSVLESRVRQFTLEEQGAPQELTHVRGLILGPGLDGEEASSLAERAIGAEIPVLWYGRAAASRLQDGQPVVHAMTLTEIVMTPEGFGDSVTAATMPGALLPVSASALTSVGGGLRPLWVDAHEGVLLARQGSALVTACDLDVPELGEESDALLPFVVAQVAAFVGRWVDIAVGRTEDEKPWGRRGPTPTPGPGLSLNPA